MIRLVSPDGTQSWLFYREIRKSEGCIFPKLFDLAVELTFIIENRADFFLHYGLKPKLQVQPRKQIRLGCVKLPWSWRRTRVKSEGSKVNEKDYVPSETWSRQAIGQVKLWLATCRTQHGFCRRSTFELPIRLVDVQVEPEGGEDASQTNERYNRLVKLCYTNRLPPDTEYLTLSHRWGDGPPVVLTHETKAQYHELIPAELLGKPEGKVFRDAIHITRCLGFRYLWIDSICINQRDDQEKGTEIMKMHQIYSGAVLNLSATSAMTGAEGMITTRQAASIAPIVLDMGDTLPNGDSGKMILFTDNWPADIESGPVNQRAWVFQERMLATRVLHFTHRQVYWECNSSTASEVHPRDDPEVYSQSLAIRGPRKRNLRRSIPSSASADFSRLWAELLQRYSKTDISFSTDRLVAISAIARTICEAAGLHANDYYAGLWASTLPRAMLWTLEAPGRRPPAYVAPTWSWASVQGQSLGRNIHDDVDADAVEVLAISTTLKSDDQFGEVTTGAAQLRCSVYKVLLRRIDTGGDDALLLGGFNPQEYLIYTYNGRSAILDSMAPYLRIFWDIQTEEMQDAAPSTGTPIPQAAAVERPQHSGTIYYYLPFHHQSSEMEQAEHEHGQLCNPFCWTSGLILRRLEDKTGNYHRVGFATQFGMLEVGGIDPPSFSDQYHLLNCSSLSLSETDYIRVHPAGQVTIELV